MLKYLDIFDLPKVEIVFLSINGGDEAEKITLAIPKQENSNDVLIAFSVISTYFKNFLVKNIKVALDEVRTIANKQGYDRAEDISHIILKVLARHFYDYVCEFEIEIVCDIEREKSPYYINNYEKKDFKSITS